MPELRVTVDDILSWERCEKWPDDRVRYLADGRESISAMESLDLPISADNRLWLVLRKELIPERELRELACRFAGSVLDIFERQRPGDSGPSFAAAAFDAARAAALDVACDAACDAACAATRAAAWAAVCAAARAADWGAGLASARDSQVEIVRSLLAEKGGAAAA